ncbi:unnamed protein product [Sympodiomycopsis kandeliae]
MTQTYQLLSIAKGLSLAVNATEPAGTDPCKSRWHSKIEVAEMDTVMQSESASIAPRQIECLRTQSQRRRTDLHLLRIG